MWSLLVRLLFILLLLLLNVLLSLCERLNKAKSFVCVLRFPFFGGGVRTNFTWGWKQVRDIELRGYTRFLFEQRIYLFVWHFAIIRCISPKCIISWRLHFQGMLWQRHFVCITIFVFNLSFELIQKFTCIDWPFPFFNSVFRCWILSTFIRLLLFLVINTIRLC